MKSIFKNTVLVIAMLGLTSVFAAKRVQVTVNKDLSIVNISLEEVRVGERLFIKNFQGTAIFRKAFKKIESFQKSFDLTSMDKGIYFFEVENDRQIEITPVLKNDKGVVLLEKAKKFLFKPQYLREGNMLKFSMLNTNKEVIDIKICTDNNVEFAEEKVLDELVVQRTYDVQNLAIGSYTLVIKKGVKTFYKDFRVYD